MVDHLIVSCLIERVDDSPTHVRLSTHGAELLAAIASEPLESEDDQSQATGQVTGQVTADL